jgi:hypothetical protein
MSNGLEIFWGQGMTARRVLEGVMVVLGWVIAFQIQSRP